MALDLPLPRQVLTHAHWTLGREKMSKSTGNVVNPFFALDRFGVDTMRYYLALDGGIQDDADYGNEYIIKRYNKGLKNSLGNLTSRIVRSKSWDVRRAVMRGTQGQLLMTENYEKEQVARIENLAHEVKEYMKRLDAGAALKAIMDVIYAVSPRPIFNASGKPTPFTADKPTSATLPSVDHQPPRHERLTFQEEFDTHPLCQPAPKRPSQA